MSDTPPHVTEIQEYFEANGTPTGPVRLDPATLITDPEKFVESHLSILKCNPGKRAYKPYYDRLLAFYLIDKKQKL